MIIDTFSNILIFKKFIILTNNFKVKILSLRILWIILCFFIYTMEDILLGKDFNMISRNIYLMVFLKNVLYFMQCPSCINTMVILNTEVILMICLHFIFNVNKNIFINFFIDIGFEYSIGIYIYILKKNLEIEKRNYFLEKLKIKKYHSNYEDLINNLNVYYLVFENQDLIYSNKNFEKKITRILISKEDHLVVIIREIYLV